MRRATYSNTMKPLLLVLIPLKDERRRLFESVFELIEAPDAQSREQCIANEGHRVRAVLTSGMVGLRAEEVEALEQLEFVGAIGAGYEQIDLESLRKRGAVLVNGSGANDRCVADHAFALLLATVRQITTLDERARRGGWRGRLPALPQVSGKKLGILGLGNIGRQIAQRASGFDIEVAYTNRRRREDLQYPYFAAVDELAAWSDYLVVAAPGGPETRGLVGASTLAALGKSGYLVNIGRASVIDTEALIFALESGTIAGAGLDVFDDEPSIPARLRELGNVVLSPHVAGISPESVQATAELFLENARRHFGGEPTLTPVRF